MIARETVAPSLKLAVDLPLRKHLLLPWLHNALAVRGSTPVRSSDRNE